MKQSSKREPSTTHSHTHTHTRGGGGGKGGKGGGEGVYSESRACGAIPNEVGPTLSRASQALISQQRIPVSWPHNACRQIALADCPRLDLVSWWSDGLHSLGTPTALSWTWVGRRGWLRRPGYGDSGYGGNRECLAPF